MLKLTSFFLLLFLTVSSFSRDIFIKFNTLKGNVKYYKPNDKEIRCIDFFNGEVKFSLKDGEYIFLFTSPEYAPIEKSIDTKKENNFFIEFTKSNTVIVNGTVQADNMNIGGTEISFINSINKSYTVTTDFLGKFTAYIPKGNYRIKTNRFGYSLDKKNALVYEFHSTGKPYNITINLHEIASFIEGRVIDEKGDPIANAGIIVKNGTETSKIETDEFGKFRKKVEAGIVTLICKKDGYLQNGLIRKIDKQSSITNLEIILNKSKFNIQGIVTDGIKALVNIPVTIHDEDINKISTVLSNENGYYEFNGIEGDKDVFISVSDPNYKRFKTPLFRLDKNINDKNLILEKN